jgi:hypothetical protein
MMAFMQQLSDAKRPRPEDPLMPEGRHTNLFASLRLCVKHTGPANRPYRALLIFDTNTVPNMKYTNAREKIT